MLEPKSRRLRDYKYCFYGCKFEEEPELRLKLKEFLGKRSLELHPVVKPGTQWWPEMALAMRRSAFCVFETATRNAIVHLAMGYALAMQLPVLILSDKDKSDGLPSNLGGFLRLSYDRKNLNMLAAQLDNLKTLPREWYAVEDRLAPLLKSASALERKLLELLVFSPNPAAYHGLHSLGEGAQQALPGGSLLALADFLRRFDELLEFADAGDGKRDGGVHLTPPAFEAQEIRLDADYRAFVGAELNLPFHSAGAR